MKLKTLSGLALFTVALGAVEGCGSTPIPRFSTAKDAANASPLGPSYQLIPLPSDDETLLGRILPSLPEPGRALEEIARPNPCAKFLTDPKTSPLSNTFEDAQELKHGAKASATLSSFGFSGDVDHATHFIYKLNTEKRLSRTDTTEYEECCAKKSCGYGYVSALIYGDGEYATGEETDIAANVNVSIASAGGTTKLKVIHKRNVKGYIAAVVNITSKAEDKVEEAKKLTPFGVGLEAGIKDESDSEMVREVVKKEKMQVESKGHDYIFKDGSGDAVTENEFARRYGKVTGSEELGDVVSRRNVGLIASGGIAVGVGVGVVVPSILVMLNSCKADKAVTVGMTTMKVCPGGEKYTTEDTTYQVALYGSLLGGALGLYGGYALIAGLLSEKGYDGSDTDHKLTEIDARLYAKRYNKALVKKTVRDLQKGHERDEESRGPPSLLITPVIGLGSIGVLGAF